jgi:hypothetical protein
MVASFLRVYQWKATAPIAAILMTVLLSGWVGYGYNVNSVPLPYRACSILRA